MKTFIKTTASKLDYVWDWTLWLNGDSIVDFDVTLPEELILESSSESDGVITAFISGGIKDESYIGTCYIETALGRKETRSALFLMNFIR